jgi:hypothetical protein
MKNLDELSVIELSKSELADTKGGLWPFVRAAVAIAYWTWDNWDELKEASDTQVSSIIHEVN